METLKPVLNYRKYLLKKIFSNQNYSIYYCNDIHYTNMVCANMNIVNDIACLSDRINNLT